LIRLERKELQFLIFIAGLVAAMTESEPGVLE
jgi:hypothetical protein